MAENKVVVNIFGEEYPITGVTDTAYISRVDDFVDSRMKQAAQEGRVQARDKVAILAALSIASELLEKNSEIEFVEREANPTLDGIITRLDQALQGSAVNS